MPTQNAISNRSAAWASIKCRQPTVAAAVGWTPSSLPSLMLWVEAESGAYKDAGTTLCSVDGDRVAQWNDLSGNGTNLTESTVKPYYKTNIINTSHPGLGFYYPATEADHLQSTQVNTYKPFSIISVVRSTSVTIDQTILGGGTATGGISFDISGSHFRILSQATTLIGANTSTIANNTWYLVIVTYGAGGNYAWRVNGASDGSGTNNLTFTNGGTRFGTDVAGTGAIFRGDIAAHITCNAVVSAGDITSIEAYFRAAGKYGSFY